LLDAKARVNARGPHLATPLQLAVQGNHRDVVEVLMRKRPDLDLEWRNKSGTTALHIAVNLRAMDIATLLLEGGADVDTATMGSTNNGITALMLSGDRGDLDIMKLLLGHSAKLELTDEDGLTALNVAARAGQVAAAKLLLDRHAKIDAADKLGNAPVMTAAKAGQLEMLKFLLDRYPSSLTNRDDSGFTLLHGAADHGHAHLVEFLAGRGLSATAQSDSGYTPLHGAANGYFTNGVSYDEMQYVAVIKGLLRYDANVDATDNHKQTPLHRAAEWGRPKIMEALLAKANPNLRDDDGKTASDIAEDSSDPRLRADVAARRKACEKLLRKVAAETKPAKAP
jgi:ankyrin repeat protein